MAGHPDFDKWAGELVRERKWRRSQELTGLPGGGVEEHVVQWRRWVFTSMKAHLVNRAGPVRAMVVVLDHWDAREFEREHAAELNAWRQRGVRFYFQLVTGKRSLSPFWVNLK